jgi:hypothetical protein
MPFLQFLFLLFEVRFIAIVLAKSLCRILMHIPAGQHSLYGSGSSSPLVVALSMYHL